jgi:hypothetical protein
MVLVCRTADEYEKLKFSDYYFGQKIYGNIDVSGDILAGLLALHERTVRRYATEGVIHRSPDNPGLYRLESSIHSYVRYLERAALERCRGTRDGVHNDYGRNL